VPAGTYVLGAMADTTLIGAGFTDTGVELGNIWSATSLKGAPSSRWRHTAIWTGSRMILWGGYGSSGFANTGSQYFELHFYRKN
jgi:hypothetical protein